MAGWRGGAALPLDGWFHGMRGCWAQDGARWTTGASAGQAGHVLAKDDHGVRRVPDLGASHGLRRSGAICDDADRSRRAAQLVESTIFNRRFRRRPAVARRAPCAAGDDRASPAATSSIGPAAAWWRAPAPAA